MTSATLFSLNLINLSYALLPWWKEFFSTVRMAGYDGDVSLEMEDLTMPMLEGHLTSLRVLKEALVL